MFVKYFEVGGPVMYLVLGAWVIVLAGVLDRSLYVFGCLLRRPHGRIARLAGEGSLDRARRELVRERARGDRSLARIEAVSQIATSLGLFGTVLGLARAFFTRGDELGLAAPEVLASGLSTALFTTIFGLIVFLFGQGFLIAFQEWRTACERPTVERLELAAVGG
ncbi:MAG: MotA/TolQ/ExbB proton channel family protein [Planctomycetota bacterium]|nr:MAG: MotA/TolQ/ExbB proton channel family protein [Planctomycetota bacterium]